MGSRSWTRRRGGRRPGAGARRALHPGRVDSAGGEGGGRRPRRGARLRREHRADARGGHAEHQAAQGGAPSRAGGADPHPLKPVLLLDAGANVEVRPEHLVQFAYMGAAFMEAVAGVERPSVGLLSVGRRPGRARPTCWRRASAWRTGPLNFVGNLEGFDLPAGTADVLVTDGFTGNVALKVLEGTSKTVGGAISDAIRSGPVSSVGGLLDPRRGRPAAPEARPRAGGRGDPARPAPSRGGRRTAASALRASPAR